MVIATSTVAMLAPDNDTTAIASRVDPAIVDINTTLNYQHASAAGTGMVLTANGEILTNNHVIEGATAVKATDITVYPT